MRSYDPLSAEEAAAGGSSGSGWRETMAGVFRLPDAMWERIEPLIPQHVNRHPLGGGRPRVADRQVMDGIFFVLRTGCSWRALDETGICHGATANRRFQEWEAAGVFAALWERALHDYEDDVGIDWSWLSIDGSMGKSSLGGEKTGPDLTDRGKLGSKQRDDRGPRDPLGLATAGANRNYCKLCRETIHDVPIARPTPTSEHQQGVCLDKAYDHEFVRELLGELAFTPHIRSRGEEVRELRREDGERPAAGSSSASTPGSTATAPC